MPRFSSILRLIFAVIFLCLKKVTFSIQKKRQSWLYFCEIYYISLSLTMIFTKLQTDAFWLWESSEDLDTILNRFFFSIVSHYVVRRFLMPKVIRKKF